MRVSIVIIGIGSGRPEHLTGEAVAAIRAVDVFLAADKGPAAHDLAELRRRLCAGLVGHDRYRFVEVADPPRDRTAEDYDGAVRDWHARRARAYAKVITAQVAPGGSVGYLAWGDPSLYDSTLRLVDQLADHGLEPEVTVIPGISSVQLLAAAHRITLNRIGRSVHITTGRRLAEEYHPALGDVVVMLDGDLTCTRLVDRHPDLTIYWGAQLGLPSQVLVRGRLAEVVDRVAAERAAVRARDGWVFDTYLLRPPG